MIVAICVDDRNGMLFHRRRQSQDRVQREDLLRFCRGRTLWMNSYSAPLFAGHEQEITVDGDFLDKAGEGACCFVEDRPLAEYAHRLEGILLYRWNRAYPADVYLDLDVSAGFTLISREEFTGSSHETITREFYKRSE